MALDSRKVIPGDLFIATEGAERDGHQFIDTAAANGAVAALVSRSVSADIPLMRVADTLKACADVGKYAREQFVGDVVAITGSAGKTTAKTKLSSVLSRVGSTVATVGNENNELGVPLTLSRLLQKPDFAVVEMGAAQLGDIRYLKTLAKPNIVILLNALDAHVGRFGGVDKIAEAKGEILDDLSSNQVAIVNADQPFTELWCQRALPARVVTFGLSDSADVRALSVEDAGIHGSRLTVDCFGETLHVSLRIPGRAGLMNALATIAAASVLDVPASDIIKGLEAADVVPGRGQIKRLGAGSTLIDDSYNASPSSVIAALELLSKQPSPRVAILGDMLELGDQSPSFHRQVGEATDHFSIDHVIAVGEAATAITEARQGSSAQVDSVDHLIIDLPEFSANSTVLVKGSRSIGLDRLVEALTQPFGDKAC